MSVTITGTGFGESQGSGTIILGSAAGSDEAEHFQADPGTPFGLIPE